MQINKIVLTGGPCAGKSTAMEWIYNHFTKLGYQVLFIPETATELIPNGVSPWTCESPLRFQELLARLQIQKEIMFHYAAEGMHSEKILIVCDRGLVDAKAYLTEDEWAQFVKALRTDDISIRDRYDAVFHLVTAAKGAEQFYTLANNGARTETPEVAREKDAKTLAAWTGHPHLRVIDNSTDFENKMKRLIAEISAFLGEPEPYEIERKFLIHMPDIKVLELQPNCTKVDIVQTYLKSQGKDEIRVRQRGTDGHYIYTQTTKRTISDVKRVETEQRITEAEYLDALMNVDYSKHPVRKTRYCIMHNNQYFEIDVYPFWDDKAIVEIELRDENEAIDMPPFINVIREVTSEEAFKNASLAVTLGKDLK